MIPKDDTPDHHAAIPSAWLDPGAASEGVGQIRSLFGCVTAIRANGATVQMQINDHLFQGDVIETGSDGRASIVFNDGTSFNLAARSRIALDEFSQQSDGSLNSARLSVSQGTFAIYAGLLGKAGNLSINTPFAIIRGAPGGAVLSLSVVAFMFVLIKQLHADPRDLGFLLDDIVNYKDLEHGTFEIVTKEAVPRLIVVDNPEVTVVMEPTTTGFSVQLVTNSPAQMAEMLSASDDAFATYRMGQADPFTMGSSKAASGGGSFDGSIGGHLASVTQTPLTLQAGGAPPPVSDFTTMQTRLVQPFFHIPTAGIASAVVDDDGLTGGNATRHLGQGLFTGLLGGSLGRDGAGANGFSFAPGLNGATATVGLETVAYSLVGNVLTATVNAGARIGTALFTVQIIDLASGVYTVTLHENVLHAGGLGAAGADTVVTLGYIITDADGSSVSSSMLSITFNDDAPTATDHATQAVAEGSTVAGTLSFLAGADGAAVSHINGTALTFGVDGYSQQIDIGPGFLKVKADGSYSFTADAVTLSPVPVASATLTVTDGDNDTAAATIAFQVTDANMPTGRDGGGGADGGTAAAAVDDDDLTGGNPADTTFTGVLGGSVGSDDAGANGFSFAGLNGTTGTVGTETVTYSWDAATHTLTATGPRGALLTVEITNAATGAYKVTLLDNVLHASGPNDENSTDSSTSLTYTIRDADNSSTTGTLTITFDDDAPVAHDDGNATTEGGAAVNGNVLTNDAVGADQPGAVIGITGGTIGTPIVTASGTLTLNGNGTYSYTPKASVPSGTVDSFTYTMKDADGDISTVVLSFTFADDNNPATAGTAATRVDEDDLASGNHDAASGDDAPTAQPGTLGHNYGLDGPGSIALVSGNETVNGVNYAYTANAGGTVLTANDGVQDVFRVNLTDAVAGSYTVTLLAPVKHLGSTPGFEDNLDFHISYAVKDSDDAAGATGTLTVTFDDDAPTATSHATQNVAEGATVTGTLDFVQGADGATVTHIGATALVFGGDGYSQVIDIGPGLLKVKADGSYSFTADAVTSNPVPLATATLTVTDGDGDTATATVNFQVTDANTPSSGSAAAAVDDDGLPEGNPASTILDLNANTNDLPGDTSEATFTGQLGGSVGSDGGGANGFSFAGLDLTPGTVGTETVTYHWTAGTHTLTATVTGGARSGTNVFQVQITDPATGAYKVTLLDNVIHATGPNDENSPDPTTSLTYSITDADGSTAPGTLTVTFDDDAPTATSHATQNVAEGATVTGTLDFVQGADGATVTHIGATALVFGGDGYSQVIDIGPGLLKVKADGSYSFTADAVTSNPVPLATATLTVTDGDGDTATATVNFQVTDANTPSSGSAAAAVDDDGLPEGNPASTILDLNANTNDLPGDTSEATFTGQLGGSVGSDGGGANGFSFAGLDLTPGTVGTETVTYHWTAGTHTLTATVTGGARSGTNVFQVQITDPATGAYKVTLLDNVIHATGPNDENSPDPTTSLTYSITDAEGSTAPGTLTVTFDDDAPTATSHATQNVAEGATVTGTLDFVQGADGATVTHIGATALVFGGDGYSQVIDIGPGLLKVKADGSYSFTADAVTSSPVPLATATLTVTDGDGDTATATVNFQVTDANTPSSGSAAAAVDDDGLPEGNPASTILDLNANTNDLPGDTSEATFTGQLGGSVGSDGAGANGFSFAGLDLTTGTVGTETVTYHWTAGTHTLTATVTGGARSGTNVFQVQITDPATGAYKVTLLDNVIHATGPNDENSPDPTTSLTYSITDAEGSTAPGTLTVTFDDDAPTATATIATPVLDDESQAIGNASGTGDDGNGKTASGTLTAASGADGFKSFAFANTVTVTADDASHPMPNAIYVDPVTHVGTQEAVTLTWTANGSGGGTLTGTSLHYPAGTPVFTLTVDASGAYVFTENAPLAHPITGTEDNLQLVFSYTVTDGDNDTASSTLTINVDDDTPVFTHIASAIVANEDNNIVVGLHDFAFGADGEQSIEVTPLTPISGLTYLTPVHNADGSVDLKAQVSGADFFDLRINPDGTYIFDLIESRPTTTQTFDFSGVAGGQSTTQFTLGDATFHSVGEILKPTSNGFGVGDGNLDSGDAFSITFTGGTDKLSFLVEHEAGAPFTMSWVTNTGEAGMVSTLVDGLLTVDPTVDFTSVTFNVTGGKAKFDNFSYTTPVLPADQTLQFSIYGVDGDGDQSATQTLSVTMLGTKAANTPTNGTSSDEAIRGTSSADTLNGSDGNDVLEGGGGNDTLAGGNGADLFVLDGHSAALNVGAGGTDIIQDFQSGLDQILVDVANLSFPLSSAQPVGSQFNFGGDINIDPAAWSGGGTDRLYYDTTTRDLWYSASGTGADKIDLAHMATGVTPAEMQGGLKIF